MILLVGLSILTYFIIEKPLRNRAKIKFKSVISILILFLIVIFSFNYYAINQKGFPKRIFSNENYTLDSGIYHDEWVDLKKKIGSPKFQNLDKTNVLIIGNSQATDTFNTFYLNKDLFSEYEFSIIHNPLNPEEFYKVSCFYDLILTNDTRCEKIDYGKEIIKLFKNSDIVILSTRWEPYDLELLEKIIFILKNKNKKVLIFNNTLESKIRSNFTILDYFVWINKRLPNKNELDVLEKQMFMQLNNKEEINKKLLHIAKKNNAKILLKEKISM